MNELVHLSGLLLCWAVFIAKMQHPFFIKRLVQVSVVRRKPRLRLYALGIYTVKSLAFLTKPPFHTAHLAFIFEAFGTSFLYDFLLRILRLSDFKRPGLAGAFDRTV